MHMDIDSAQFGTRLGIFSSVSLEFSVLQPCNLCRNPFPHRVFANDFNANVTDNKQ